jgi:hypothetical protein
MKKLLTFDDVLALWETPKALSDDLGTLYVTAQLMKRRRSIGVDHWPRLIELLAARGYTVTTDDLLEMRKLRAEEGRKERSAA